MFIYGHLVNEVKQIHTAEVFKHQLDKVLVAVVGVELKKHRRFGVNKNTERI